MRLFYAQKEDIGKHYNMKREVSEDGHYYICHDGRELRHVRTETRKQDGFVQTVEVYGCADCGGCPHKAKCLYKYDAEKDAEKNKVMKVNERWEELREESHANIQSEKGILNRQIRPIQTKGHFRDIKEKTSPAEESMPKGTEFCRRCLFGEMRLKNIITRQPHE